MEYRQLGGSGLKVPALSFGAASATTPVYPYWHRRGFAERNPPPIPER